MALKKTVFTQHGFEAVDAYHRVEGVRMPSNTEILFQVRSYKDNSGVPHFDDAAHVCQYDMNVSNPLTQAYAYLKALPEFSDATDC